MFNRTYRGVRHSAGWGLLCLVLLIQLGCGGSSPESMLEDANIMLTQKGDVYVATMILEDMIGKYPDSELIPHARLMLGRCYMQDRQFTLAREQLEMVLQGSGNPASEIGFRASQGIVFTYWNDGRKDEAIQYALKTSDTLKMALPLVKASMQAQLIGLYLGNEMKDEAEALIRGRLRDKSATKEEHAFLFKQLSDRVYNDDKPALLAAVREYIQNYPESDTATNMRFAEAGLLRDLGQEEESGQVYRDVMDQFQARIDSQFSADEKIRTTMIMAHMEYVWGAKEEARIHLESLIEDFPMSSGRSQVMMQLAEFYLEKDRARSRSLLEQVIREFPEQGISNLARQAINDLDAATTDSSPLEFPGASSRPASQPSLQPAVIGEDLPTSSTSENTS
jgi:TolA-binding protein